MKLKSSLPTRLKYQAVIIEEAARAAGLDFFEVEFELLSARDVNGVAAYQGFPVRYPSWRYGMEFERLQKGYRWGLSKIYELVINNDPTIAYLVSANSLMEQKLVMAHVYGHADFFKNNVWFAPTDRHMLDTMGNHATRVRRTIDSVGLERVEHFMDCGLCIETLIDPFLPLRELGRTPAPPPLREPLSERARATLEAISGAAPAPSREDVEEAARAARRRLLPTYDVMGFLAEEAPLEPWQRDILRLLRVEAYYFAPQRMTKIINEGWASYWHSKLLTDGILDASEILDFADCHSGATATQPGQLNPYKLGIDLFRFAEAQGEDILNLRRVHNDVSMIDKLVTEEFVYFSVSPEIARSQPEALAQLDWRASKARLLQELSWGGLPKIELVDLDTEGEGELLLVHRHDGRDLQLAQAGETLRNLETLWKAPVVLLTLEEGQGRRVVCRDDEVSIMESSEALGHCAPERAQERAEREGGDRRVAG